MSVGRLELPTNGLKGHCSTIELHAHNQVIIVARDLTSVNVHRVHYRILRNQRFDIAYKPAMALNFHQNHLPIIVLFIPQPDQQISGDFLEELFVFICKMIPPPARGAFSISG